MTKQNTTETNHYLNKVSDITGIQFYAHNTHPFVVFNLVKTPSLYLI